jgi:hypothetical protein
VVRWNGGPSSVKERHNARVTKPVNGGRPLDNVDPHIGEVVKAACEELPLPARASGEHAIAIFGKEEVDECSRPEQDCC